MMTKIGLLDDLIIQEILLEKAAALKVEVPTTELDTAEANAKKNIPDDVFQQQLTQRGLTAADMRESLRRQLLTDKLVAKEVTEKITISDQEITDFFNANKAQFNVPEEAYHLAQIVITPVPEQQVANGTGDDAQTPQAAAQKVARRSAQMADKVSLEIAGVIENMSGFTTPDGQRFPLFGEGGGQALADELDVPLLAKVPLTMALREQADLGVPLLEFDADDPAAQAVRQAARGLIALMPMQPIELPVMQETGPPQPVGMSLQMA
jgi:hypothetical protein